MKSLYLLLDFFTLIVPLLFSFHPKIKFYLYWAPLFKAIFLVAIPFILLDSIFVSLGIWGFNTHYVSGYYLYNLPFEEILFFVCIPFSCVFTYYCFDKFFNFSWKPRTENIICILLSALLLMVGILNWNKRYSSITFISTAVVCLVLTFKMNIKWFGKALSTFGVLLIPFIIVNGILTGTCIEAPVVHYNNAENLGIRVLTIPLEDFIYGFELYLLNLYFYKRFMLR